MVDDGSLVDALLLECSLAELFIGAHVEKEGFFKKLISWSNGEGLLWRSTLEVHVEWSASKVFSERSAEANDLNESEMVVGLY